MTTWRVAKLGTLAEFKNGLNFSAESWGRGLKIIGVSDFGDRIFPDYQRLDEINPSGVVREQDMLEEDDIVFVRSNGNRQLIGRCLHIRGLPEPVSHSGFTIRLRFKVGSGVHVPYFVYLFRSDLIRQVLSDFGGGTNINNLNQGILENLKVPVPELDEQRKIAAILSAYDDLIANNQRRIALLEGMAEEIYREWFVRMRFPGYASAKWEHGLPARWRAGSATEVVNVQGGGTPRTEVPAYWDGEIPFFSPKDSHGGAICIETEQTITEAGLESCASQLFEANTIFITARGTVGNIVLAGKPMAMNQSCYALVPKNRAHLYFVFVGLRCAVSVIKGVSNSGVFDNIVMDTFKIIPMIDPGPELASEFSNLVRPMFEQSLALRQANQALRTQRDALLPRLISGKLKVDHLDIRLPPSMRAEAEAVA